MSGVSSCFLGSILPRTRLSSECGQLLSHLQACSALSCWRQVQALMHLFLVTTGTPSRLCAAGLCVGSGPLHPPALALNSSTRAGHFPLPAPYPFPAETKLHDSPCGLDFQEKVMLGVT